MKVLSVLLLVLFIAAASGTRLHMLERERSDEEADALLRVLNDHHEGVADVDSEDSDDDDLDEIADVEDEDDDSAPDAKFGKLKIKNFIPRNTLPPSASAILPKRSIWLSTPAARTFGFIANRAKVGPAPEKHSSTFRSLKLPKLFTDTR